MGLHQKNVECKNKYNIQLPNSTVIKGPKLYKLYICIYAHRMFMLNAMFKIRGHYANHIKV